MMQSTNCILSIVASFVLVLVGATAVHDQDGHCGSRGSLLMQVKQKVFSGAKALFIQQPVPMSGQQMATVDTTGMVKAKSGDLTFFTYPTDQDTFVSASISPTSYWEKDISDRLCRQYGNLAGKADFLDVGANIGTWSIPMAQCLRKLKRGGSVIAVEALGLNAKHVAASAHANSLENIELFNYAVGEGGPQDHAVEKVSESNKGGSAIVSGSSGKDTDMESVSMTTLDAILKDRLASEDSRIFGMKMDIENYELYALRGAPRLLREHHRPCLIYVELRVNSHAPSAEAMQLLKAHGYERDEAFSTDNDHVLRQQDFAACAHRFVA